MNINLTSPPTSSNDFGAVHQVSSTLSLAEALISDLVEGKELQVITQINPDIDLGASLNDVLHSIRYVLQHLNVEAP